MQKLVLQNKENKIEQSFSWATEHTFSPLINLHNERWRRGVRVQGFFRQWRRVSGGARHGAFPPRRWPAGRILARAGSLAQGVLIVEEVVEWSGVASRHTHKLGRSLELSHEPVELPHVAACRVGEANHRTSRGDGCGESGTAPPPSCWEMFSSEKRTICRRPQRRGPYRAGARYAEQGPRRRHSPTAWWGEGSLSKPRGWWSLRRDGALTSLLGMGQNNFDEGCVSFGILRVWGTRLHVQ